MNRDKFLTEIIGLCWHEEAYEKPWHDNETRSVCKCGRTAVKGYHDMLSSGFKQEFDFSTWRGFGKLWEWASVQPWWDEFVYDNLPVDHSGVNPHKFAVTLYEYLTM